MAFFGVIQRPEERESLGAQLGRGLGAGIGQGASDFAQRIVGKRKEAEENEALKRITGQDFTGMSPEIKREFLKLYTGGRSQKEQEKHQMLETGLGTIQKMRELLEYSGGFTSNPINKLMGLIPGETQKKRAELAQLGTSLIPLAAAGVSIRNQREFDKYSKIITDPNSSPSELEGALDGLESIIGRQLSNPEKEENEIAKFSPREAPNTSSEMVKVVSPEGKIVAIPKKDVKAAMKAGGKVVK